MTMLPTMSDAPTASPTSPTTLPSPTTPTNRTLGAAAKLRQKLARAEARTTALRAKLERRERFSRWHGKTSARATACALLLRRSAPADVLKTLGLGPLSAAEAAKLDELLAAFAELPWTDAPDRA